MPNYRADELHPPSPRFDVELLERAIRAAVANVSAPVAPELGDARVRWGDQLDVRQLATGDQRGEIAGYLAKYATKSTEQAGGLLHRIARDQVDVVKVREHVRSYHAHRVRPRRDAAAKTRASAHVARRHRTRRRDRLEPGRARDPRPPRDGHRRAAACPPARRRPRTVGRIVRLLGDAAEREDTTLPLELDSGARVHLADVASIGPACDRRPASTAATRGSPRARTRSATAATA